MTKDRTKILLTISLLIIVNLFLVYFLKYDLNGLSIKEFSVLSIGNLLNILISSLTIFLIIFHLLFKQKIEASNYQAILFFLLILFLPLIGIIFLTNTDFNFSTEFFLFYPTKRVYTVILFIINLFAQIYVLVLLFELILSSKTFVYIQSLIITIIGILLLFIFSFIYTTSYESSDNSDELNDIAVVLGAAVWSDNKPSPLFRGRIEKAFDLYKQKNVQKILVTGGNAPGEVSEAKAALNYLTSLGVGRKDILIEENTSTTADQIKYIKEKLIAQQNFRKIVIVSDQFHLRRVMEMCSFYDVKARGVPSDYNLNFEKLLYYRFRDSFGLLLFWFFAI